MSCLRRASIFTSIFGFALACVSSAADDEMKKQPPPEFSSGYHPLQPTTPYPRAEIFGTIDVVVLVVALILAAYLCLNRRSRGGLRALSLFCLLYFGFYRQGCICPVGSLQNVALALSEPSYRLPLVAGLFFVIPMAFTLFYGRVFCSSVCPLGAAQETVLIRPLTVPTVINRALSILPYLYLGFGVLFAVTGSSFIICRYDPFVGFFRLAGRRDAIMLGAALLALSTFVGRPYCRWLCPYGVLLRWLSPFARYQVHIAPDQCVNCHLCADSCPYGAINVPQPQHRKSDRRAAKSRLARAVFIIPFLIVTGGFLGWNASPAISHVNRTVSLADRLWQEEHGSAIGASEAATAWHQLGKPNSILYLQARRLRSRFIYGSTIMGSFFGLILGFSLAMQHRRNEGVIVYDADPASCYSCGRCYDACPAEQERLVQLTVLAPREQRQ